MLGIRSWFGLSGISVWTLDFLLLCTFFSCLWGGRFGFWIRFFSLVTAAVLQAGGSFFQFSYSSLQLVVHAIILFGLRHLLSYYVRHGDCHSTAAELLTDAQASKLVPTSIHSIRVGDRNSHRHEVGRLVTRTRLARSRPPWDKDRGDWGTRWPCGWAQSGGGGAHANRSS